MSARGEGAGQPSTSAQGQPAAPAPQKRGRGRPRKQQQVSTLAGWAPHTTFAPSARAPRRAAPRTRESGRHGRHAPPAAARGRAAGSRARLSPARPRRSGRGGGEPGGGGTEAGGAVGGSASSDFRYCAPSGASRGLLVTGSGPGSDPPGLAGAFLRMPRGKEVRGGRMLWRGCSPGGRSRAPSPAIPGCERAGVWGAAAAPLAPSLKCLVAGDSRPPDKELVGRPVLAELFKCGGAAEVCRERG